jgi:vancomycin resistance protein YoaR
MRRRRGERPDVPPATPAPERDLYDRDLEHYGRDAGHSSPPRRHGHGRAVVLWLLALLLLLGAGAGGGLYYMSQRYEGRIYPNISILGIDMSQQTPAEARRLLEERLAGFVQQPVTLTYAGRTWQPSLEELGGRVELDRAIEEAHGVGRGLNLIGGVEQIYQTWEQGLEVPVHITVDGPRMQRYLQSLAAGIDRPAVESDLIIEQSSSAIRPAQQGRIVLIDETSIDLVGAIEGLAPAKVALRTKALTPLLLDSGVEEAKRMVDAVLQGPIELSAGESLTWTLTLDDLRALLRVDRVTGSAGASELRVEIDELALRQRIATYADEIGRGTVNPRVRFIDGALTITRPGETGLRLDEEASVAQIKQLATSSERKIDLVVREVQPDVTEENLDTLGIVEAVGTGQSSFIGSAPYRITNIKAGTRLLDGILIAPDEEFSFNNTIGTIGPVNGFVEGYAIVNNRTQKEFGGGICQDSTTLFRAAFHAGLPITERHEHSFRISWYEVFEPYGMDAAIFTGALDFRFVNDTGHWLLLQTYVDDANHVLTYTLYGTRPDREVYRSDPYVTDAQPAPVDPVYVADKEVAPGQIRQSDTARGGMTITIYRTIVENGEVVSKEPFVTRFQAWPNIFLYNPTTPPAGCTPGVPCTPKVEPTPEVTPEPTPEATPEPTPAPPPTEQPPAEQPPAEQPPAEQPPAGGEPGQQ